jgi:hypothetical protein
MPQKTDALSPRSGKVASYLHARVIVANNPYAAFTWLADGQRARE